MGERVTVIFTAEGRVSPAVYLHSGGCPDAVYALLEELDRQQAHQDAFFECGRFVAIAGALNAPGYGYVGVAPGPEAITPEALVQVQTDWGQYGFFVVHREAGRTRVRRFVEVEAGDPAGETGGRGGRGQGRWLRELSAREVAAERRREYTAEARDRWGRKFNAVFAVSESSHGYTQRVPYIRARVLGM